MKRNLTLLAQIITVLLGAAALAFLLIEPIFEGRNANATLSEVYFNDPFLLWAYSASIAFFVGLYQLFKLIGYIGENKTISEDSAKALGVIKHCAQILIGFALLAEVCLFIFTRGKDDIAGGVFMGLLMIATFGIIEIVASKWEKRIRAQLK
jgi:hypothetical protein